MKLNKRATALTALFLLTAASLANATEQVKDFSFKDINGKTHKLSDYRGKWVIANYWATYCGPCIAELPALTKIAGQFKDKAVVLGMEAGETPTDELKQFVAQKKLNYTVVPTQDSTMYSMGLLYGVPTTFIVDPQGNIVDTHMGAITTAQLQSYMRNTNVASGKDKDSKNAKKTHECTDPALC